MSLSGKTKRGFIYFGLFLWLLVNLFPVYWMFTFSLKNNEEIFGSNVAGLPQHWLWSNYESALKIGHMGTYFLNSAIVATATILITLAVALMATFALTRLIWKRRRTLNKFFMLGLTIPIHASIVPVYVTLSRLHLLNTYWALIIPYSAFSLAMAILVCTGFMNEIPRELDEAACIDGCGVWRFLPGHRPADEARRGDSRHLHVPAVLERADVRQHLYQQERAEDAARRRAGPLRPVHHRMGPHRRSPRPRDVPDAAHLRFPEPEDSGELHRRRCQGLTSFLDC